MSAHGKSDTAASAERRGRLPYDPEEWSRRLAEARARRAARLRERDGASAHVVQPDALQGGQPSPPVPAAALAAQSDRERMASNGPSPDGLDAGMRARRKWIALPPLVVAGAPVAILILGIGIGVLLTRSGSVDVSRQEWAPTSMEAASQQWTAAASRADTVPAVDAPDTEVVPLAPLPVGEEPAASSTDGNSPDGPGPANPVDEAEAAQPNAPGSDRAAPPPKEAADATAATAEVPVAQQDPDVDLAEIADLVAVLDTAVSESEGSPGEVDEVELAPDSVGRVVVHVPPSVPRAVRDELVALLREGEWPAEAPRTAPITISEDQVRYFHAADREAAEKLAAQFSAGARDFTSYRPRPDRGLLEVWLSGRAPRAARAQRPNPAAALSNFLDRVFAGPAQRN